MKGQVNMSVASNLEITHQGHASDDIIFVYPVPHHHHHHHHHHLV